MRKQLLTSIIITLVLSAALQAQTFTGTYQLNGVKVTYINVARLTDSPDDSVSQYTLDAHWPSIGSSAFSTPLAAWAPGDTIAVVVTPDILLVPAGLAAYGIDLTVGLNQEESTMLIPGIEGTSNTYPTTDTEDCSTFAVIAPVTDNADITFSNTSNSYNAAEGSFTWGFGISESVVFDWFDAPSDWEDPAADGDNFGIFTAYFNDDNTAFDEATLVWHAVDGQDSDSGIDEEGLLNRHLGVTLAPGDTVTVAALAATGAPVNVGTYPILGGAGVDLDGDGVPDGTLDTDWGYYFDPVGADGIPFNGDEPFQYTGYYFTFNGLAALNAILTAAGDDADGDGIPDNFMAAILGYMGGGATQEEATLLALADVIQGAFVGWAALFGVDATTAAVAAATVVAYAQATYTALVALGDPDALMNTVMATTTVMGGVLTELGIDIDDSDHDYDGVNGRLVFQIGNSCVPDIQTRDVVATFDVVVQEDTASVVSEDILPAKFAVYENYPNPFNPSTNIIFDIVEQSQTDVSVWNLLGQKVAVLFSGDLNAGRHSIKFDGHHTNGSLLPSGVYIYRIESGNNVSTKKMMLLK